MHRTPLLSGMIATLAALLFVIALAAGFGVDLTQAITQALPVLIAAGAVIALSTGMLRRELA